MQDGRTEWGPMGSFPGAAGATPARLVEHQTQDAPDPYLPGSEGTEGADRHEAGNVSRGDTTMYEFKVAGRKDTPEPRVRRLIAAGRIAPGAHAQYVLGILIDAVSRSYHRAEAIGHVLEVAQRAETEGDHSHAAALRAMVERVWSVPAPVALGVAS